MMTKKEKEMWEDDSPVHITWADYVVNVLIIVAFVFILWCISSIATNAADKYAHIAGVNRQLMRCIDNSDEWKAQQERLDKIRAHQEKVKENRKLKKVFGYIPSDDEVLLFKLVAMHESGNTEPHEGIVALMSCFANRVARDDRFEDTIIGVAYHPGQMTCVTDGSIWDYSVNSKVEAAWEDLINGGYKRHPRIVAWTAGYYNPYFKAAYPIGGHCFGY